MKREQLKEALRPIVEEALNEASKDDFVATYKGILVTLKNGYKEATEGELSDMYEYIGKYLKNVGIPVKDVKITIGR